MVEGTFFLNENSRKHLQRHFSDGDAAGSHFYPEAFPEPDDLIIYVNTHEHYACINQPNHTSVWVFHYDMPAFVGNSGIIERSLVDPDSIIREVRYGFTIDVACIKEMQQTRHFCVVAKSTLQGRMVITAFPGQYAPPFPSASQPIEQRRESERFWNKHLLVKLIQ